MMRFYLGLCVMWLSVTFSSPAVWAESLSEADVFKHASEFTVFVEHVTRLPFYGSKAGYRNGSGFIVDAEQGLVVTNRHVAQEGTGGTKVRFHNQKEYKANIVYVDPKYDLAVLKVQIPKGNELLQAAEFGDSDDIEQGHPVGTFGNPSMFSFSASRGIVSATDRRDRDGKFLGEFFQTDAAISGGNSGGPLIDLKSGKVIGINTFVWNDDDGKQIPGLGFALKTNEIKARIGQLVQGAVEPKVAWIGLLVDSIPEQRATANYGLKQVKDLVAKADEYLVVLAVTSGGPTALAGIQPGDLLVRLNGEKIQTLNIYETALQKAVGTSVSLEVLRREGAKFVLKKFSVSVQNLSSDRVTRYASVSGMLAHHVTVRFREDFGAPPEGVLVAHVESGSQAELAGLSANDVIRAVNGQTVNSIDDLVRMLKNLKKGQSKVELFVKRYRRYQTNRLFELHVEKPGLFKRES